MGGVLRFELIGNPYHQDKNGCRFTFWEEVKPFKKLIKLSDKITYKQSSPKPKKQIPVAVPPKKKVVEENKNEGDAEVQDQSESTAYSSYVAQNDEDACPPTTGLFSESVKNK